MTDTYGRPRPEPMTAHQLARILLEGPDLPIATAAMGYEYIGTLDCQSHGKLKVGILEACSLVASNVYPFPATQHVIIGDMGARNLNYPNWWISEMIVDDESPYQIPWEVGRWVRDTTSHLERDPIPAEVLARSKGLKT